MSCGNTAVCWKCSAPFSIHFYAKDDALAYPPNLGRIVGDGRVLEVTTGSVRMPFNSKEIVLCVIYCGEDMEFRVLTSHIKKIVDENGLPIYE